MTGDEEELRPGGEQARAIVSFLVLPTIALIVLSGCAREPQLPGMPEENRIIPEQPAGPGPCKLLTRTEAELAANAPLAGPPPKATETRPIVAGMHMCSLHHGSGKGLSAVSWGVLRHSPGQTYDRFKQVNGGYLTSVRGLGSDGVWDPKLRTLVVLVDDAAVFGVRVTSARPPVGKRHGASYFRETAERLAELALKRLT